jgi:hypothetical protein
MMSDQFWIGGPFRTDQQLVLLGQGASPRARVDKDGRPKCSPDGRPTFSSGCMVLTRDEAGEWVPSRGTLSVHVIEPAEKYGTSAVAPTLYTTDGITWITPYVSNGYSALSVVTERLVAHKTLGGGDGAAK